MRGRYIYFGFSFRLSSISAEDGYVPEFLTYRHVRTKSHIPAIIMRVSCYYTMASVVCKMLKTNYCNNMRFYTEMIYYAHCYIEFSNLNSIDIWKWLSKQVCVHIAGGSSNRHGHVSVLPADGTVLDFHCLVVSRTLHIWSDRYENSQTPPT